MPGTWHVCSLRSRTIAFPPDPYTSKGRLLSDNYVTIHQDPTVHEKQTPHAASPYILLPVQGEVWRMDLPRWASQGRGVTAVG